MLDENDVGLFEVVKSLSIQHAMVASPKMKYAVKTCFPSLVTKLQRRPSDTLGATGAITAEEAEDLVQEKKKAKAVPKTGKVALVKPKKAAARGPETPEVGKA